MYNSILIILFASIPFLAFSQEEEKTVSHVLWINIPELGKAGIDSSNSKNIKYISKKGFSNFNVTSGKSPYKELMFSCDGKDIFQALESNNEAVKTAAFVANKDLYKMLSKSNIDNLKKGNNDIELTEWAYDLLREEKPNFLFVNFSGVSESAARGNKVDSKEFQRAVAEVDVMISGIFKGLIESRLYGRTAIIISSFSEKENGILLIQADNIVEPGISNESVKLQNVLPSINLLIGKLPDFNCSENSIVELN